MWSQGTSQGAKATIPPIPKVDAGAAAAPSARDQVRKVIRDAVNDARTDARNAARTPASPQAPGSPAGIPSTTPPRGEFNFNNDDIPPQVMNVISMSMTFVAVIVLGLPIVRMIARRFDRKTDGLKFAAPDLTPQLRQLQDSVDAMAIEVERISEGQRFTSKLLAERGTRAQIAGE